ncbi:PilC/PilY family type IV pilus protein [Stenotrophomonas sp. Ker107b]
MKTGRTSKYYDNGSELYYAAIRYLRRLGNVAEFSALSSNAITCYRQAGGFPVITRWDDPIAYQCQSNTLLGIGDTNTWKEKILPAATSEAGEDHAKPAAVAAGTSYDVVKAMTKIWHMPADATRRATAASFHLPQKYNSGYIAALVHLGDVTELHPDSVANGLPGKQTLRTCWVDVIEKGDCKVANNQYVVAAKYGGFKVPDGVNAFDPSAQRLPDASRWNDVDLVNGDKRENRPRTFFAASDATRMVASLEDAFQMITQSKPGAGAALASNGGALDTDGGAFSATYRADSWSGDLVAYGVDATSGATSTGAAQWSAAARLHARERTGRNLYTASAGRLMTLQWSNLSPTAQGMLGDRSVLDYLASDRSSDTLGHGGRGVFALDETEPASPSLLWEYVASTIYGLGRLLGKPLVAQVADGDWRVVLGNGVESSGDASRLISIGLAGGDVRSILFDEHVKGASGPCTWDADRDGFAETTYVGDLACGVYRVNLPAAQGEHLFAALSGSHAQPITAAPLAARNPDTGETLVFIGSGALLDVADLADASVRTPGRQFLRPGGQGPNAPGSLGDWLGGSGEDGGITNPIGDRVRRVSWREVRLVDDEED